RCRAGEVHAVAAGGFMRAEPVEEGFLGEIEADEDGREKSRLDEDRPDQRQMFGARTEFQMLADQDEFCEDQCLQRRRAEMGSEASVRQDKRIVKRENAEEQPEIGENEEEIA